MTSYDCRQPETTIALYVLLDKSHNLLVAYGVTRLVAKLSNHNKKKHKYACAMYWDFRMIFRWPLSNLGGYVIPCMHDMCYNYLSIPRLQWSVFLAKSFCSLGMDK